MISKEQMAALSAPFPISAHTVREGFKNGGKTKIRWFTYIDVREVVKRLDEVFPGAWSTTKPEIIPLSTGIIATIGITINGETRWYSGADDFDVDFKTGEVQPSADQGKGAVTDAIRRAASLWGVAEYIYSMDLELWTDSYERNDWDKQKTLKAEALKRFTDWYNRQFSQKPATNPFNGNKVQTPPPPAQNARKVTVSGFQVNLSKKNTPYQIFQLDANEYAYSFTRDPFRKAGYTVDDWAIVGNYELTPPAELTLEVNKTGQLEVKSVAMVDVFDKVAGL